MSIQNPPPTQHDPASQSRFLLLVARTLLHASEMAEAQESPMPKDAPEGALRPEAAAANLILAILYRDREKEAQGDCLHRLLALIDGDYRQAVAGALASMTCAVAFYADAWRVPEKDDADEDEEGVV